mmetsp:Transcript_67369/g.170521  ORF Transcript_67369/g.170521 Transcript_67369/m.170521 type:complete len:263 (-) Transcript_67369:150-938(-)
MSSVNCCHLAWSRFASGLVVTKPRSSIQVWSWSLASCTPSWSPRMCITRSPPKSPRATSTKAPVSTSMMSLACLLEALFNSFGQGKSSLPVSRHFKSFSAFRACSADPEIRTKPAPESAVKETLCFFSKRCNPPRMSKRRSVTASTSTSQEYADSNCSSALFSASKPLLLPLKVRAEPSIFKLAPHAAASSLVTSALSFNRSAAKSESFNFSSLSSFQSSKPAACARFNFARARRTCPAAASINFDFFCSVSFFFRSSCTAF